MGAICSACGASALAPHLQVAGEAGHEGLIPTTDRYGTALSDIARCGACGHMQLDPLPAAEVLESGYAEAESLDYVEEEAGERETARRTLELIERQTGGPGVLLDLGCWVGFLASEAEGRGWRAKGIEPSAFASAYARERLGLDVISADLMSAPLEPGAFQAAFMGDVIEHLLDPGAALERVHAALAPAGVLALALPDAGSRLARAMGRRWWSVLPTHVQYFTRHSLTTLLGRHGFEVVHAGTAPKAFTVRYYAGRLGGYSRGLARAVTRAAELSGTADRLWAPDFRDRMLVIARR
jgi:SAM-dependent methyltransferase